MSILCASFESKLIVFHYAAAKLPNIFNLSVPIFRAYVIKLKKSSIINGNILNGVLSVSL